MKFQYYIVVVLLLFLGVFVCLVFWGVFFLFCFFFFFCFGGVVYVFIDLRRNVYIYCKNVLNVLKALHSNQVMDSTQP